MIEINFQNVYFISLIYSNPRIVLNIRPRLQTHIVKRILSVHSESILNDLSPHKTSFGFFGPTTLYEHTYVHIIYFISFRELTRRSIQTEELIDALKLGQSFFDYLN